MILIPDSDRKFPLVDVPYHGLSMNDMMENMLVIKRANCPGWTDESASDMGVQLLWLYSVLSKLLVDRMTFIQNNSYIGTVSDRGCLRELASFLGYTISEAKAASVDITFTMSGGHPEITIPKGTQVATVKTEEHEQIIFETNADTLVQVGITTKDIACTHGYTVSEEVIGSSDGTTDQQFTLSSKSVIWQSEIIEVDEGEGFATWTRVSDFTESSATDKHYKINADDDGYYHITFGDGVNGKIPVRHTNGIRATYRVGGGLVGNVAADQIIELIGGTGLYIDSVTNANAATGGEERESIEHARRFAPAALRTLNRVVTIEDIENICNAYVSDSYGAVAKSKATTIDGGNFIRVMIVPAPGGYPLAGFKTELNTYLDGLRMICTGVEVVDPIYVSVDVTATVYARQNYSADQVAAAVRNSLIIMLSANYQDMSGVYPHEFGTDVRLSKLYEVISSTLGVSYCAITLPTGDVTVGPDEISDVGDITLTVSVAGTDTSYYFPEEDNKAIRSTVIASQTES